MYIIFTVYLNMNLAVVFCLSQVAHKVVVPHLCSLKYRFAFSPKEPYNVQHQIGIRLDILK